MYMFARCAKVVSRAPWPLGPCRRPPAGDLPPAQRLLLFIARNTSSV